MCNCPIDAELHAAILRRFYLDGADVHELAADLALAPAQVVSVTQAHGERVEPSSGATVQGGLVYRYNVRGEAVIFGRVLRESHRR